jgi:hypothetical protein
MSGFANGRPMRRRFAGLLSLTFSSFVFGVAAVQAVDWPDTAGWTIGQGDDFCFMAMEYEGSGESELLLGFNLDRSVLLILSNYNWSAEVDKRYELKTVVNEYQYSGPAVGRRGDDGRRGFAAAYEPEFRDDLAAGQNLKFYLGDTLIDQLSLKGSSAALAVVDRCLAQLKREKDAAEAERRRLEHIPKDPFAAAPVEPSRNVVDAPKIIDPRR